MGYWIFQCSLNNYQKWIDENRKDWSWGKNNSGSNRARNGAIECFKTAQSEDLVLCYVSGIKKFLAVFEIQGKALDKEYKELIKLKLLNKISVPLENISYKQNDFPFIKNHQGTYYKITKKQFDFIYALDNSIDDLQLAININKIKQVFTTRHETGEKAEIFFKKNYERIPKFNGIKCKDKRLKGLGYDFELDKNGKKFFVEVKGISGSEICNSVLFTEKEWEIAKENGESYFLVIANITQNTMQLIQNPSKANCLPNTIKLTTYNVDIKTLYDKKNLYKIR